MPFHPNIMTETPDMDTMGGRLSRAREAKSMTVGQVATRIGVKAQTISAWESFGTASQQTCHACRFSRRNADMVHAWRWTGTP